MKISRCDTQLVIVSDVLKSKRFYHETFDLPEIKNPAMPADSVTLRAGHQLLVLVTPAMAQELGVKAAAVGGSMVSLVAKDDPEAISNHLKSYFVTIIHEWQPGFGAEGNCQTLTLRDPDANLVVLTSYHH